jgi:hypothetical protein
MASDDSFLDTNDGGYTSPAYIAAALCTLVAVACGFSVFCRKGVVQPSRPKKPQALVVVSTSSFQVPPVVMAFSAFGEAGFEVRAPPLV